MISINDLVQMSVVLDDEFLLFSKNRPDSFVFLLTEVSERNYIIASRAQTEIIKSELDVSALFCLIYKRRNLLDTNGTKLRQWSPFYIIDTARYMLSWNEDEYIISLVYMSYLCLKSALKHHIRKNYQRAATYAIDAQFCINVICNYLPVDYIDARTRSFIAKEASIAKLKKDPKQTEKSFVFDCWKTWQEKPRSYKYKSDFAKDMLDKCEHLESQKKIEDWCRDWEKTHPARTKLILLD